MKRIQEYHQEFEEEVKVNRVNLEERIEKAPKVTHKWLYRSFEHKKKLEELIEKKEELIEKLIVKYKNSDDPKYSSLSDISLAKELKKHKVVKDISKLIKEQENLVQYCEEVTSICKFQFHKTYDGILKIIEFETM